jgi:hypothetical protein
VHALPHLPQLALSVCNSTQEPLQLTVPASPQSAAHAPRAQNCLLVQVVPHIPQLEGSVARLTHAPLQSKRLAEHWHTPATHVLPPVHVMPQLPQLALSELRSTHEALQAASPTPQVA